MTYPRKQVTDILVGLLRVQGVPEDKLQAQAAAKLDEAVARVTPLAKSAQDIPGWRAAVADLHAWLSAA